MGFSRHYNAYTPELDAKITEMWIRGVSASQIGIAVGRTKNSIIGRVHRLELHARRIVKHLGGKPRADRISRRVYLKQKVVRQNDGSREDREPPKPFSIDQVVISDPIDIMRLTPFTCRWPYGEPAKMLYCGAVCEFEKAYCDHHHRIAYTGIPSKIKYRGEVA